MFLISALQQAQLEIYFHCPPDIQKDQNQTFKEFEKFWNIETPRFGEPHYKGWDQITKNIQIEKSEPANLSDNQSKFFLFNFK